MILIITPVVLLIAAGVYLFRPLPDGFGMAEVPNGDTVDFWVLSECQLIESMLCRIRRTKRPYGILDVRRNTFTCHKDIPLTWQRLALNGTPLAFEVMIINQVYGSQGKQYAKYRLKKSELRKEIESAPIINYQNQKACFLQP
jgi:hypothetical protein